MRAILCALVMALGVLTVNAAPPNSADDLTLKVKVALALSQSQATACGECVFDEPEARAEAMRSHKPLVLLVGGCDGRGKVAVSSGAVACVVKEYDHKTDPRLILLTPKGKEWLISGELPANVTDAELRKAIAEATPAPPKTMPAKLDWDIQATVDTPAPAVVPAEKVKRYRQVCRNGVCVLEEITE